MKDGTNKRIKRAAVTSIALALVTASLMSTSLAKYMTVYNGAEASNENSMDVAKWDIDVTGANGTPVGSDNTISVSPTVDRNTTSVVAYEENFDGETVDWTDINPDKYDDPGVEVHTVHRLKSSLTYVESGTGKAVQFPGDSNYRMAEFVSRDKMLDADVYSVETDMVLYKRNEDSNDSTKVVICFNEKNYFPEMTKADRAYVRLYIRLRGNNGAADKDGKNVCVALQNVQGQTATTLTQNVLTGVTVGKKFKLRLEVDNMAKTIKVYVNENCFINYQGDENIPDTSGSLFFETQFGKATLDNLRVVKKICRPITTIYKENFENGIVGNSVDVKNELGWETTIKPDMELDYATGNTNQGLAVEKTGDLTAEQRNVIVPAVDMIGVKKYSISMDVQLKGTDTIISNASTGGTEQIPNLLNILFNGEDENRGKTEYMRLDIRPCNTTTNVGNIGGGNFGGIGVRLIGEGVTNPGEKAAVVPDITCIKGSWSEWFNVRLEVDNDKETISVYVNNKLMKSSFSEGNWQSLDGPIILWTQYGESRIDNIQVDVRSELLPIYTESFNNNPSVDQLGWGDKYGSIAVFGEESVSCSDGGLTLFNNSTTVPTAGILISKDEMLGADKFSIDMDVQFRSNGNLASNASDLRVLFNEAADNSVYYNFLILRPTIMTNTGDNDGIKDPIGSSNCVGAILGYHTTKDNRYQTQKSNGISNTNAAKMTASATEKFSVRIEVDNINKTIDVYSNGIKEIAYSGEDMFNAVGSIALYAKNSDVKIDNISVKRSFTNINKDMIAPGMGGSLAEVNITNSSQVDAEFELVMKMENMVAGAAFPKSFVIRNASSALGVKAIITKDDENSFTVVYSGIINRESDPVQILVDWEWAYSFNGIDTDYGSASTSSVGDISVKLESLKVSQIAPGRA